MIKAIETVYMNYRFRSRLEARWATFFEELGIPWEYEKEGFDIDGEWYLPDFYLPSISLRGNLNNLGVWIEIKPIDHTHSKGFTDKYYKLARFTNHPLVLYHGLPDNDYNDYSGGYEHSQRGWDNYMRFCKCINPVCGHIKIEYFDSNYMHCPKCNSDVNEHHPSITYAMAKAKEARFGKEGRG